MTEPIDDVILPGDPRQRYAPLTRKQRDEYSNRLYSLIRYGSDHGRYPADDLNEALIDMLELLTRAKQLTTFFIAAKQEEEFPKLPGRRVDPASVRQINMWEEALALAYGATRASDGVPVNIAARTLNISAYILSYVVAMDDYYVRMGKHLGRKNWRNFRQRVSRKRFGRRDLPTKSTFGDDIHHTKGRK